MNENIKKEGMKKVEEYNENPYNSETQEERSFSNNHENIKKNNTDDIKDKKENIAHKPINNLNNDGMPSELINSENVYTIESNQNSNHKTYYNMKMNISNFFNLNNKSNVNDDKEVNEITNKNVKSILHDNTKNDSAFAVCFVKNGNSFTKNVNETENGGKKKRKKKRRKPLDSYSDDYTNLKKKKKSIFYKSLLKKKCKPNMNNLKTNSLYSFHSLQSGNCNKFLGNNKLQNVPIDNFDKNDNNFFNFNDNKTKENTFEYDINCERNFYSDTCIISLLKKKKKKKKIYNILHYNEHFRENQYKTKNKESLKKKSIFYGLFFNKYKKCKLNDINKNIKTLSYAYNKWGKTHKYLQCENYNLTLRNIQKRQRLYFYHKENMLSMFNCFIRKNCKSVKRNKTLEKRRCGIRKEGFKEMKSLIRGHGYKSNKSEKTEKNNKSNKMNNPNVSKENIDNTSNNLVNDDIKMKRKPSEENKSNEINDNINNKVKNDIQTEEANKELRITGKSFVKYNQHVYEKYYNDIFLRIGKIVTNKKKIYFLTYKIIKESYFRILILNNEKLERNILQVVAIQDVTLSDKNVRIYSDPFYIRNNGNLYGVKFLKFFALKYFKKKKNIEDIIFSDVEIADKNSNKTNIENETDNSKIVKSEKEKKDSEETILSKSGTDTEDNNANTTNCNSDENEQKENKTNINLNAAKASKDKNNTSINKSKEVKNQEKDTPKSSISSNSNNNTLNYDSDDNEKGKKNQSCKNEKCANMTNKKGRNTNSKVKNEKVSNTKNPVNNNDKNSKKANAKNAKNNNKDPKIKKNPNEINKNIGRNKTYKKTNNSKARYNKNASKEDEECKYSGVIYNSKRKYYFNITKISDIISMVKGSEDRTKFYLDTSSNNMKKKLKLFKKVEKTLFLENLNIDGEEILFKRPKFFNCIIEEVFENYNILYETEDGNFNMFENKYDRLKKNVVSKPENDLSNKYIELKDEERGFRYIGYRVSFELKTDNKKKSTLKTGIIKYYSPKYKQFFIHHIENIKFNLSVDSPKSINRDVSNTRNYSRASSFSYNTIVKDINHSDYNTENNLSNANMTDINYGDPQGCLNVNGNKTDILEKYSSENKSPKYNIKMQDEVEKKKPDFIFSDVKGWYSPHFYNIKVLMSLKEYNRFDILDKKKEAHDLSILNNITKCFLCKNNILFIKGHDHYTSTLPTTIYDLSSEAEKKEIDETNTINVHWGVKCFMCSKTFHAECLGDEVIIAKSYDKNVLMKEYKKYIYKNSLKKDKKSTKKSKRAKSPNKKETTKSTKGSINDNKKGKVKIEYASSKSNTNSNSLQSSRNPSFNCINDLSNEIGTQLKKNITSKTRENSKILRSNSNSNNNNSGDNESSPTKSDDLNDENLDDEYSDAENNNHLEKSKTKKSRKYLNYVPSVKYSDIYYKKYICKECYRCIYCCESIYNYKQTPNVANYVICKSCNMVAHGSCCFPNVPEIYLFNWKCDDCLKCSKCDYSNLCFINYNEWELHLDCCINCYKEYEKKNFCIICNEKYKVDDSNKWVECDVCKFWIHLSCDKDEDRNIETLAIKHIDYKCPTCRSGSFIDKIERILYLFFLLDKYKNFTFHVPINFYIYWRIVKIPMNLYIMKEKLWGKKYNTISDFLYDFILIVHNAKTVHMPNTSIYKNACNFEKKGKAIIKNMFNMSNEELNKYIDDCLEKYKKIIADDITNNESSNNVSNTNIDNNFSIENSKLNNNSNSYNFNMDYMLSKYNGNMGTRNNATISDYTYKDKKNNEYSLSNENINLVDINKDSYIHQENYNDIGQYGSTTINSNDNLGIEKYRENTKNSGDRIRYFQEGYDIKNLENNYNRFERQNGTDKYNYRNMSDNYQYAESNMLMNNFQKCNAYETNKDNIQLERNIISKFETSQFDKLENKDDTSYINNNSNQVNINNNPYKKRKREIIEKDIMNYDLHELFNLKKNSFFFQSNKDMFISDKNDIIQYSIININTNSKIYFNTSYNKYDDFDTCKILKIHFLKKYSKTLETGNCDNSCSEAILTDKPQLENTTDEINNNDYLNRSTSIVDDLATKTVSNDDSQNSEQVAFNEAVVGADINKNKMTNDDILYNHDKNKLLIDSDIFMIDIMKEKIKINNVTREKKRILSPINDTLKFLKCIQIIFFNTFDTDERDKIVYPLNESIYQSYKKSKRDMAYINDTTYSGKEYEEIYQNNKNDNLLGTNKEISIDRIISSVCKSEIIKSCDNKIERNKNYTHANNEQTSTIKHIEGQGDNFLKNKAQNIKKKVEKIKILKNDILKEYCFICGCVEYKYPLLYCSSCGCSIHYSCANVSQPFLFKLNCYFEHKKDINNIFNVISRNFKCYNCIKCDGCGDKFDDEIKRSFYSNTRDKNPQNLNQFEKGVYNHLYNLQMEVFSAKIKKSSSNSTQNINNNTKNIMIKNENNLEHAETDASISLVNVNNYDDNNMSIAKYADNFFVNSSACENTPITDAVCVFDKPNFADKIEKNETDHNVIPTNANKNNKKNYAISNNFENNCDKNISINENLYTNNMNNKSCEILDTEKSMGNEINNSVSKKAEKEKFDTSKKGMVNILNIHEQTSKVIKCFCCGKSSHNHCFYRMDKDPNNINPMVHKKNYRNYIKKYNRKGSNKKVGDNYYGNNGINYKNFNSDISPIKCYDHSTYADNNSPIYFIKDESISKYNLKNSDILINNNFEHAHILKNMNNTNNIIFKNIQEHGVNAHTAGGNIYGRESNNNIYVYMNNPSYINSIYHNNTHCNANNIYNDDNNNIIIRKGYEQFNDINIADLALRKNYIQTHDIYSYIVPSNEVLYDSFKICLNNVEHDAIVTINDRIFNKRVLNKIYELIDNNKNVAINDLSHLFNVTEFKLNFALCEILNGLIIYLNNKLNEYNLLTHSNNIEEKEKVDDHINNKNKNISIFDINFISTDQDKINVNENIFKIKSLISYIFSNDESIKKIFNQSFMVMGASNYVSNNTHGKTSSNNFNQNNNNINVDESNRYSLPIYNGIFIKNSACLVANGSNSDNTQNMNNISKLGIEQNAEGPNNFNNNVYNISDKDSTIPMDMKNGINNKNAILLSYINPNVCNINGSNSEHLEYILKQKGINWVGNASNMNNTNNMGMLINNNLNNMVIISNGNNINNTNDFDEKNKQNIDNLYSGINRNWISEIGNASNSILQNINMINNIGEHKQIMSSNSANNVNMLNNIITNKVANIATNDTISNALDVKNSNHFDSKIYRHSSLDRNLDSHKNSYFFYKSSNNNIVSNNRCNSNNYGSLNYKTASSVNMLNKFKANTDINNNYINEVSNDLYDKIKNKEIDPNEIFIQNNNPHLIFVNNPYNSYNQLQDVKSYDNLVFQKNALSIYDINNKENKIGYICNNNFITNAAYNYSNNDGSNKKEKDQVKNLLKDSIADFDKIASSNKNIKSSCLSENTLQFAKLKRSCSNIYNIDSNCSNYKYNTVNNLVKQNININKSNSDCEEKGIYKYRKNLSDSILSIREKTNINFDKFNTINTRAFFDLTSLHVENKSNVNQNLKHAIQNIKNGNNYIYYSNNTNNGCDIICNSNKTESTIKLVDSINSGKIAEDFINTNKGTLKKNCKIIEIKREENINSEHSNEIVTKHQDDIANNNLNENSEIKTLKKQNNNGKNMNNNDEIPIENIITPVSTNVNEKEKHISSISECDQITDGLNIKKGKKKPEKGNEIVEEKNGAKKVDNENNDKNEEAEKEGKIEKGKKGERTVREKKKKQTKRGKGEEKEKTNDDIEEGEEIQSKKSKTNKSKGARIKVKKEKNNNKGIPNENVNDLSAHQTDAKYMNNNANNIGNSYNADDTHNNDGTIHLPKKSKSNSKSVDKKCKLEKKNKNNDNHNLSENNDFYLCSDIDASGYSPYHKIYSSSPVKKIKINKLNRFLKKNSFILKSKFKRVCPNSYLCHDCVILYKSELSFDAFNDEIQNFEKNMHGSDEIANLCNAKKNANVEQIETFKSNYNNPPNNIISNGDNKNNVKTEYKDIAIMENTIGHDININNNNSNQINIIEGENNNIVIFKNNKNSFEQSPRNMHEENSSNILEKCDDKKDAELLFGDNINNKSQNSNAKTTNDVMIVCNNEGKNKFVENVNENKCGNLCRMDNNKQPCQNSCISNSNNIYFTLNNSNTLEWDKENTYWSAKISSFNNIYYNMNYFKSNKAGHTIINDLEKNKAELYKCSVCCILYEYKISERVKIQNEQINSNLLFICNVCNRKYNYIFKYMKHSGNKNQFIIMNDEGKKNNKIYPSNNCFNSISINRNSKLRNMLHELVYFVMNMCYEHIYEKKIFLKNIFNLLDKILKGRNIKLLSLLHFSYTYFVYDEFYLFFQEKLKKSMFLKRKKNTYLKKIFYSLSTSSFVNIMECVLQQFYNHIYNEVGYTQTGQNKHSDYLYTLPKRMIFLYYTQSNNKFEQAVNYSIYILYLYYVRVCYCKRFLFRNIENRLNIKRTNKRHKKSETIQAKKKKKIGKGSKQFKASLLKGDKSDSFYNLVYNFNYKMVCKPPNIFNKITENMNDDKRGPIGEENCVSTCSYKPIEEVNNSIDNLGNIEKENNITNSHNEKNNKIAQMVAKYDEECEQFIQNYYEKIKSIMKNKINLYVKIMLNKYIKEGINILKDRKMKNGTNNSVINNNKEKNNKICDNKICFFCNYGNYIYKGQLIPFYDIYMHSECLKWSLNCTQYYNYNKDGVYEYNKNLADAKNNINDTTINNISTINNATNTTSNTGNNKKNTKKEQMKDKNNSKNLTSNKKSKKKSASNYVDNYKNDAENSNVNKNNKNINVLVKSENPPFIKNEKISHDTHFNLMNRDDTNSTIETNNALHCEQKDDENVETNIKKRIKNIKLMERLEYIENKHSFNNYQNIIEVDEDDIKEIIYDSVNSTCFLCGYKNASIYCSNENCSVKFHLNCAFYSTIIKNYNDSMFFNYKKLFNLIKFNNDTIFCNLNNSPHKKEEGNCIFENNYNDIFPIHIIFKTKKIWCNHCWNDKSIYESFYLKKENASHFTSSNCMNDPTCYEQNQIIADNTPSKNVEINNFCNIINSNMNDTPNLESTVEKKEMIQENSITCVKPENDMENKKLISYTNDKKTTSTQFLEMLKQHFNSLLEFYFENGSYYVMDTILHNINENIKIRYKSKSLMVLQEIFNKNSKIEKKMKELENVINKYANKKNDENYIDDKYNLIIQESTKNNSSNYNDISNERHETKNAKKIKQNEGTINNTIVDIQKIIDNKDVSNILKSYFILKNFFYIGNFTTLKNENYFFSKKNENSFVKYLIGNEQTLNVYLSDVLTTNQIKMSSFACKKKCNENDMANCSINEDNKTNEINSPENYCIKYVEYDNESDDNASAIIVNCNSETEEPNQYINDIDNNIEENMKYKKKSINIYFKNLTDMKDKRKVSITRLQQVSSNFVSNRESMDINKIVERIDEGKNKSYAGKEKLSIFKKRGKTQEYINDRKWSNTSSNASIANIMLKKECFLNLVTNNNDIYIKQINDKYFLNYKYNTATNNYNNLPFNHSKCNVIKIGCHNILNIGEIVKYEGEEIIYPCGFLNMRIFFNLPSSVLFHIYKNANINDLCLKNSVLEKICLQLRATYIFSITLKNNNLFFSIILFPLININYFSEVDAKKFVLAESHNINELYNQFLSYFNYQNEIYITEQYKKFTKKYSKLYEYMAKFIFKSAEHNKSIDAHSFFGLTLPCVIYHIKYKLFKFIWANLSSKINTHAKRECERDEIKKKVKNCNREVKYNDNILCKYSNLETSIFKDSEKEMEKNTRKITKYKYNINSAMSYRYLMNISSNSRLYVKKSSIHGYGLYTREFINEGEPVIEYIGEYIRNIISDKREKYYEKIESSCYMFRLNENIIIDATKWGNVSRFINHSCEPNCFCKIVSCDQNLKHIVIFAKKDILPHEEITYDYQFGVESEGEKLICLCGSSTCLGRMN
ncbi:SET domain protein, putative [Plasmodium vinckei]|uniref:[histone H3]-lysine(4) N-trimethyltransferase n=1 Tax=Plasmodium vinckei TaxID=5860 RepID=A0A6V7T710_PLAVN|nr:SET domain protein, putative [Plasmodium vinckei]